MPNVTKSLIFKQAEKTLVTLVFRYLTERRNNLPIVRLTITTIYLLQYSGNGGIVSTVERRDASTLIDRKPFH